MQFEDLTPEQREKLSTCTTKEELIELAKTEGYELSEDALVAITGGDRECLRYEGKRVHRECGEYVNPFPLRECQPLEDDIKWQNELFG
ncbi:MAG: Nif11-like leader peptide family natural product precursor [Atopobiaceae bacterium]|nr:Nif11-like leader peptide family natural product precursor [Atopobiaceae bacterium]